MRHESQILITLGTEIADSECCRPFPGAATGAGGEIRDESAVGRGSATKAGLCGFWVSDLLIPDRHAPWEIDIGRPAHYASSLDIMLEAPIGSARFNNEFGRPCLTGCFRTLLTPADSNGDSGTAAAEWRGYHKPILIAGGVGTVRQKHALKEKKFVREDAHVIVLGGPAMLIGLGGGAASSNASGEGNADLDFNSVQRGNPEVSRPPFSGLFTSANLPLYARDMSGSAQPFSKLITDPDFCRWNDGLKWSSTPA